MLFSCVRFFGSQSSRRANQEGTEQEPEPVRPRITRTAANRRAELLCGLGLDHCALCVPLDFLWIAARLGWELCLRTLCALSRNGRSLTSLPPAAIHVGRRQVAPDDRRGFHPGELAEHQLSETQRGRIVAG